MPTLPQNSATPSTPEPKWWGHSLTLWGVAVTTLSTVAPIVARACGVDLPAQLVQDLGTQITAVVQAIGGLTGIVITVLGRIRATQPLALSATPPSLPPFGPRDWRKS